MLQNGHINQDINPIKSDKTDEDLLCLLALGKRKKIRKSGKNVTLRYIPSENAEETELRGFITSNDLVSPAEFGNDTYEMLKGYLTVLAKALI